MNPDHEVTASAEPVFATTLSLRLDNGPELTAIAFTEWCTNRGIEARFIQAGKPDQNAFMERFNKTYRDEVLDAYVFETVEPVREITDTWLQEYNEEGPHDSLGRVPPLTFMPRPIPARESTNKLSPDGEAYGLTCTRSRPPDSVSVRFPLRRALRPQR